MIKSSDTLSMGDRVKATDRSSQIVLADESRPGDSTVRAHSHVRLRRRTMKKSTLPKRRGTEQRSMLDSRQVFRMSVRSKTRRASCLERHQSRTPKRACASTSQNMDLLPICSITLMAALQLLSSANRDWTPSNTPTMRPLKALESCYEATALCPAPSSLR
jgi:hypothetical protein